MGTIPCSMFYVILVLKTHPPHLFLSFVFFRSFLYYFFDDSGYATFLRFLFCFDMQISLSDIERHLRKSSMFFSCIRYSGIDGNKRLDG